MGEQDPIARLDRELERLGSTLKSQIFSEIGAAKDLLLARLEGMDARLDRAERWPTDLDREVKRLEALFDEKLEANQRLVDEKIKGLRALLEEQRDAATTAVSKSEDAMRAQLVSTTDLITAVKERVDKTEGRAEGAVKLWGMLIVGAMLVVGVVGLILTRSEPAVPPVVVEERR